VLQRIFDAHLVTGAIHFAALKAVGESVSKPIEYYSNNVGSLLTLLGVMRDRNVKQFVFSSSATVYGVPKSSPIDESFPLSATNPYGQSKLIAEQVLRDLEVSDPSWRIATLRYFNPVGAHESGLIGEDPAGVPNNLMPYVAQVAVGKLEKLRVFGGDYDTPDGTGVRDYIHVVDLARGHLAAFDALEKHDASFVVNLGTGQGYSVLDVLCRSGGCGEAARVEGGVWHRADVCRPLAVAREEPGRVQVSGTPWRSAPLGRKRPGLHGA